MNESKLYVNISHARFQHYRLYANRPYQWPQGALQILVHRRRRLFPLLLSPLIAAAAAAAAAAATIALGVVLFQLFEYLRSAAYAS